MTPQSQTYYKYLDAKGLHGVIESMTLYWKDPRLFNDPFDCQYKVAKNVGSGEFQAALVKVLEAAVHSPETPVFVRETVMRDLILRWRSKRSRINRAQWRREHQIVAANAASTDNLQAAIAEMERKAVLVRSLTRVLCVAAIPDSLLMWAHYAGQHSGGVVALTAHTASESMLKSARPVRYMSTLPDLLTAEEWARLVIGLELPNVGERMADLYLRKGIEWEYEEEYRCLYAQRDVPKQDRDGILPVALTDEISGIYFGVRMAEADKAAVRGAAEAKGLHVPFFQARIATDHFGVTFDRLS